VIAGQVGLGNFMVNSTVGDTTDGNFTGLTQRQIDGKNDANITSTTVPVPAGDPSGGVGTPEPGTLALAAIGLPLLGLLRARRRL
jgi:hypothetical protein